MAKKLSLDFISMKTKNSRLESIKTLNVWGNEFEDISILSDLPNIEILSLAVNKIESLAPLKSLHKIKEIYLRNNLISDMAELDYLAGLPNLKVLTLNENPISLQSNYREEVLSRLPQLTKLDDVLVSVFKDNQKIKIDNKKNDKLPLKKKIHKLSKEDVINKNNSFDDNELIDDDNPFKNNMSKMSKLKEEPKKNIQNRIQSNKEKRNLIAQGYNTERTNIELNIDNFNDNKSPVKPKKEKADRYKMIDVDEDNYNCYPPKQIKSKAQTETNLIDENNHDKDKFTENEDEIISNIKDSSSATDIKPQYKKKIIGNFAYENKLTQSYVYQNKALPLKNEHEKINPLLQSNIMVSNANKALESNKDKINFVDINSFPNATIDNKKHNNNNNIEKQLTSTALITQTISNEVVMRSIKLLLTILNNDDLEKIKAEIDILMLNKQ